MRIDGQPAGSDAPSDTPPEVLRMQVSIWRSMSSTEKAELVRGACAAVLNLAREGIRMRHPGASDQEQFLRMAILRLGREQATKVYPAAAGLDAPGR